MSDLEHSPIGIEVSECFTALGSAQESCTALLEGKIALKAMPVLGKDGGDEVPLATRYGYDETIPPRWESELDALEKKIPNEPWGAQRYPVFVTSSNYDVGSLYAYRNTGDAGFAKIGTPINSLNFLKEKYGWGENVLALSHACVTAHLGIEMATRYINLGVADKVLVFSFDYISPFVAGGFHSLKILNQQFPAPYQDRETGSIGLGDGSAFVVLSKEKCAARIESNFLYNEMYHFTSNDPAGSGFAAATDWLKKEAKDRRLWIKGHGTGTLDVALLEANAFNDVFPNSPMVGWKGSIGHTLGSCGLVELAIVLESIKQGKAPGTVGSSRPTISSNIAIENFDTTEFESVALFSNAFGGAHAGCLISYD